MNKITIISWANKTYCHLFEGLRQDCERLGYPYHLYMIEDEYPSLVKAWCNHPKIIRRGVEDYGTVLFLDVECRIVAPIPVHWQAPLVSVRRPIQKFWIRFNSGTVLADRGSIPWLDAWIRVIEEWELADLEYDDYVRWPGDLNDEVALAAALAALGVKVNTVLGIPGSGQHGRNCSGSLAELAHYYSAPDDTPLAQGAGSDRVQEAIRSELSWRS